MEGVQLLGERPQVPEEHVVGPLRVNSGKFAKTVAHEINVL